MASGLEVQAPARNLFPFAHKPNTLDRDRIVVPAGWDSWGKIGVLRDGFDAKMWGEAWERDLEAEEGQTRRKWREEGVCKPRARPGIQGEMKCFRLFRARSNNYIPKPPPLPPFNNPTPEQTFLAKNYDEKKAERDPRGAFRNPQDFAGGGAAGIVGPLGSSSFSLPNVERAMSEMETGMGGPSLNASRPSTRTAAPTGRSAGLATLTSTGPCGHRWLSLARIALAGRRLPQSRRSGADSARSLAKLFPESVEHQGQSGGVRAQQPGEARAEWEHEWRDGGGKLIRFFAPRDRPFVLLHIIY